MRRTLPCLAFCACLILTSCESDKVGSLRNELRDAKSQISALQSQNEVLQKNLTDSRGYSAGLSSQISSLHVELSEARKRIEELEREKRAAAGEGSIAGTYGIPEASIMKFVAVWVVVLLVLSGLVTLAILLLLTIAKAELGLEKLIRVLALVVGFLGYFGARAVGLTIPQMLFSALKESDPVWFSALSLIGALPLGLLVSWYLTRMLKKGDDFAYRFSILVGTFVTTLFAELLATALEVGLTTATLAPNVAFTIGLGIYLVSTFDANRSPAICRSAATNSPSRNW